LDDKLQTQCGGGLIAHDHIEVRLGRHFKKEKLAKESFAWKYQEKRRYLGFIPFPLQRKTSNSNPNHMSVYLFVSIIFSILSNVILILRRQQICCGEARKCPSVSPTLYSGKGIESGFGGEARKFLSCQHFDVLMAKGTTFSLAN
jgi:hypothetical protein